jgi:ubiquitin carboxyl-terminal hydrolase L3
VCTPLKADERAATLEGDEQLESAYRLVALAGDSEVPANAEDEVDFHYVCFAKSHMDSHLYELDGDRKGPIDWGWLGPKDDILCEMALSAVRTFIQNVTSDQEVGFSLLALAPALAELDTTAP